MKPVRLQKAEQRQVTLTIESLSAKGDGLGRIADGRVYVTGVLPGEEVSATLFERSDRDVYRARLDEITKPSAERAPAPCPHYDSCGGCSFQHMNPESYRTWKVRGVIDRLSRAGINPTEVDEPVFIAPGSRRRATFVMRKVNGVIEYGFHRRASHEIVGIDGCLLVEPALLECVERMKPHLLPILKEGRPADLFIQHEAGQFDVLLTGPLNSRNGLDDLSMKQAFAALAEQAGLARVSWRMDERDMPEQAIARHPFLMNFGALTVALPSGAFLQPSRDGEGALCDAALSMIDAWFPAPENLKMADLFSGCGTFAGRMMAKGSVHCVETDQNAVTALQAAGARGLSAERKDLFRQPVLTRDLNHYDAVLFDPPRAGAHAQAVQIAASKVPCVIAISCDPQSFSHDADILMKGGYECARLRVVDQFPWSGHVELAALFTKGKKRKKG